MLPDLSCRVVTWLRWGGGCACWWHPSIPWPRSRKGPWAERNRSKQAGLVSHRRVRGGAGLPLLIPAAGNPQRCGGLWMDVNVLLVKDIQYHPSFHPPWGCFQRRTTTSSPSPAGGTHPQLCTGMKTTRAPWEAMQTLLRVRPPLQVPVSFTWPPGRAEILSTTPWGPQGLAWDTTICLSPALWDTQSSSSLPSHWGQKQTSAQSLWSHVSPDFQETHVRLSQEPSHLLWPRQPWTGCKPSI